MLIGIAVRPAEQPSSSASPATEQTENRSTNVTSPFGSSICNTGRNQRRFGSPPQKFSATFRRGGNSTIQCGINHRSTKSNVYQHCQQNSDLSEVILLPGVAENEVVRGSKKSDLMRQGFIRGELERNKRWSDAEIYTDLYII